MELLYTDNGKVQHRSLKDNNEMDIIKEYSNEIDYESTTEAAQIKALGQVGGTGCRT